MRAWLRRWLGIEDLATALIDQDRAHLRRIVEVRASTMHDTTALAQKLMAMTPTTTQDVIPHGPLPPSEDAPDPHIGRW